MNKTPNKNIDSNMKMFISDNGDAYKLSKDISKYLSSHPSYPSHPLHSSTSHYIPSPHNENIKVFMMNDNKNVKKTYDDDSDSDDDDYKRSNKDHKIISL